MDSLIGKYMLMSSKACKKKIGSTCTYNHESLIWYLSLFICFIIGNKRKDCIKKRKLGRNPRVPFTQHQVAALEQKFHRTQYLSSMDVAELSTILNLTETRVCMNTRLNKFLLISLCSFSFDLLLFLFLNLCYRHLTTYLFDRLRVIVT
jgi:homeobox protein MSX